MACGLPQGELGRVWRGYYPGRSGEIQLVTKPPNVIGNWKPHSGPWSYIQRVPLFWYGPGRIPALGRVSGEASMVDVAPTIAQLIRHEFKAPDGTALTEVLSTAEKPTPPRLVLVMVWDGGGRNVLRSHPRDWPLMRRLIPEGVWYEHAEVGSSPSLTPPIHANLGTGAFPMRHGVPDSRLRLGKELARPEYEWPHILRLPTLADVYDRAMANEPKVGVVATMTWHVTMIGHGSAFPGGDKDVLVLKQGGGGWGSAGHDALYRFPPHVADIARPDDSVGRLDRQDGDADGTWHGVAIGADSTARLDRKDGKIDGAWYGREIRFTDAKVRKRIAHAEWQTRVVKSVIDREGFGADEVPDLLFTNFKHIDDVAHGAGMEGPEMAAAVRSADVALGELVAFLDQRVGRGEWVVLVTADHGLTPDPGRLGGLGMFPGTIGADVAAVFDDDGDRREVVQAIRPTEMWVDVEELQENGFDLDQLARFMARYTRGQYDEAFAAGEDADERVFSLAIPGPMLRTLPCLP